MSERSLEEEPCAELETQVIVIDTANQRSLRPNAFQTHPEFADRLSQIGGVNSHQGSCIAGSQVIAVALITSVAIDGGSFRKLEAAAGGNAVNICCVDVARGIDDAGPVPADK